MPLCRISRHPAKETNVSDEPHNGGWELALRMPGDMVLHQQDRDREGGEHKVCGGASAGLDLHTTDWG
jgi:hypothetical protein